MGRRHDHDEVNSGTVGTFVLTFILIVMITVINSACILISLCKYYSQEWQKKLKEKKENGSIWADVVAWIFLCASFALPILDVIAIPLERLHVIHVTESYCWATLYAKLTLTWGIMQSALFMFWWLRLYFVFSETVYEVSKRKLKGFVVFVVVFALVLQSLWITRMFGLCVCVLTLFRLFRLFCLLCCDRCISLDRDDASTRATIDQKMCTHA